MLAADYELAGQIIPEAQASVSLHGATAPFGSAMLTDERGRFRFRRLAQGAYTVVVFEPGRGEARETVEVGPGVADPAGRVKLTLHPKFEDETIERAAKVSARELSIPPRALREFEEARKSLQRPDAAGAVAHLKRAVEIAPQFPAAWNQLGTIAYQSRKISGGRERFPESPGMPIRARLSRW